MWSLGDLLLEFNLIKRSSLSVGVLFHFLALELVSGGSERRREGVIVCV
jgi:hypothetical protein